MKYKILFYFLCFCIILISYITFNINKYMGNSLELREINFQSKKCHNIGNNTSYEDIIKINDIYLIASQYRTFEFYASRSYLFENSENDNLYLINAKTQSVNPLIINNFPEDVPFHPHGLDLLKKDSGSFLLYIVNHAINNNYNGEERIEIINVSYISRNQNISLNYKQSIILPNNYFLTVNSIAVFSENKFYFTTYSPFPAPNNRKYISYPYKIKYLIYDYLKLLFYMLNIKKCYVYKYTISTSEIFLIKNSQSLFNNGISYDNKRQLLYVIKTMEKEMNIFDINNNLKLIQTIPILYIGDNVFYDYDKDLVYIGFAGKFSENSAIKNAYKIKGNFNDIEAYSGYEILDPKFNYSISELMVMKNNFRGVSSALKINGNIYMVSIYSKGIYICSPKIN